jgi:hypothetical protein
MKCPHYGVVLIFCFFSLQAGAQLVFNAQIRTRSEWRNGYGTLLPKTSTPSFHTSQRSRLGFNYKSSRVTFQAVVQDVRVWGQDASTINNNDGSKLALHEGWADIVLANKKDTSFRKPAVDFFSVKIGRQELLYDDSRLLGNLDWLQQARRHDAVVFKLLHHGWQADLGVAFNQNSDAINYNGTYYTPANVMPYVKDSKGNLVATPPALIPLVNPATWSSKSGSPSLQIMPGTNGLNQSYKAMQFFYLSKSISTIKLSGLFFSDQFGKYILDSVKNIAGADTGYVYGRRFNQKGVNTRITTGLYLTGLLGQKKAFAFIAGFYYQAGHDRDALQLSAYTSTVSLGYIKNRFSYTAGWDYVSGNDAFSSSTTNHRFDPLYGTPHKFWGYMDYFYAGSGSPAGGLSNPFFKIKYNSKNKRLTTGLDYHYFALAENQKDVSGNTLDKYLGSELDFVTSYALNKFTTIDWGFSYMAATHSMEYAKSITPGSARLNPTWSYLMLNIKPEFLFK